jgi:hypothetical protein
MKMRIFQKLFTFWAISSLGSCGLAGGIQILSPEFSSSDNVAPLNAPQFNAVSPFDIVLDYSGSPNAPTAAELASFAAAEATWESIIIGMKDDLVDLSLEISVNFDNIDGVGGTLGSAGPTLGKWAADGRYLYAAAGTMTFDTSDTANMEANRTLNSVILHEMAHVMGFGTIWSSSAVGLPGFQELYVNDSGEYTGTAALAAYQQEYVGQEAATFVPVELEGGPGTANGHWNEGFGGAPVGILNGDGQDANLMLMSGWLNPSSTISTTTIAQWEDMGYMVIPELASIFSVALFLVAFLVVGITRKRS